MLVDETFNMVPPGSRRHSVQAFICERQQQKLAR
jgi:hypothetical protein